MCPSKSEKYELNLIFGTFSVQWIYIESSQSIKCFNCYKIHLTLQSNLLHIELIVKHVITQPWLFFCNENFHVDDQHILFERWQKLYLLVFKEKAPKYEHTLKIVFVIRICICNFDGEVLEWSWLNMFGIHEQSKSEGQKP